MYKIDSGKLCDDPRVMFIGILYIAMNLLHTILHCQTPSLSLLSVSRALVVVAHYLWVSLLAWGSVCPHLHQHRTTSITTKHQSLKV